MSQSLPLEIADLLAPILMWVEHSGEDNLPNIWRFDDMNLSSRRRGWLVGQMPRASYDKISDLFLASAERYAKHEGPHLVPSALGQAQTVDGLQLLREDEIGRQAPFLAPPSGYDLAASFGFIAARYFQIQGNKIRVKHGFSEELHHVALRFPMDVVLRQIHATWAARGRLTHAAARQLPDDIALLETTGPRLRALANRGLAEGHLHLKALTNASDVWQENLLSPSYERVNIWMQSWRSPGREHDPNPGEKAERHLLLLARIAGRMLAFAVLLSRLGHRGHAPRHSMVMALDALYFARDDLSRYLAQRRAEEALLRAKVFLSTLDIPREWGWLLAWIDPHRVDIRAERHDAWFGSPQERTQAVHHLHFEALYTLVAHRRRNDAIRWRFVHELFYRYLVIRTQHWRLAVQHSLTTGFRFFKEFFDTRQRRPGWQPWQYERLIFERLRSWRGLRVLEGRVSPSDDVASDLEPWVLEGAHALHQEKGWLQGFGLIVHFIKEDRPVRTRTQVELQAFIRDGWIRRRICHQATRLFRLLSSSNPIVPFIVGIDTANIELVVPPEVFAGTFRFLRGQPIAIPDPSCRLADLRTQGPSVRRLVQERQLGATYHVGEDFRHLLSGLRAIDETLSMLAYQPGDRLGHAIALGIDPNVWIREVDQQIIETKQAWLDTLVWVHQLLGSGSPMVRKLRLEQEIRRLSLEIYGRQRNAGKYGEVWAPMDLYESWRFRALDPYSVDTEVLEHEQRFALRRLGFGEQSDRWYHVQVSLAEQLGREVSSVKAYRLLQSYWFNKSVYDLGEKRIRIDLRAQRSLWVELCEEVQRQVQNRVVEEMIVVEANPSANLFIGPMSCLDEHPIFNLTLDPDKRLQRRVRVTVNTDNPAIYNTSLAQQFDLLAEVLTNQGQSEGEVEPWLKWLRNNGRAFSFARITANDSRKRDDLNRILTHLVSRREALSASERTLEETVGAFHRQLHDESRYLAELA